MALAVAPLLCPFTVVSNIFTLKDTAKTHYNNAELNIPNNAPLAVYQATLAEHWLVMGLKIDNSPVDVWLSKMEAAIENIASFAATNNLAINQLMECEAAVAVTAKVASTKEPKWTMVMAKNMHQVVNRAVETLADAPKQEGCKLNLRLTSFEAKEGETEKELVQWLNTKLLQCQMKLCAKVVAAMRQQPTTVRASAPAQCCSNLQQASTARLNYEGARA
jgi:hypothetical protein